MSGSVGDHDPATVGGERTEGVEGRSHVTGQVRERDGDDDAGRRVQHRQVLGARFGVVVSEKAVAQAVPIIGAAGGALVNSIFIDHFQDMARGHFIVRRLERTYGEEVVKRAYEAAG